MRYRPTSFSGRARFILRPNGPVIRIAVGSAADLGWRNWRFAVVVDPGGATRWLHRSRLSDAPRAADAMVEGVRFLQSRSADLLSAGLRDFSRAREQQRLSDHAFDSSSGAQRRRALAFLSLCRATISIIARRIESVIGKT